MYYGKKHRYFGFGQRHERREHHPLFPRESHRPCGTGINRPSAYVLQRAASLDVPALCFSKDEWADGRPVLQALQAHAIDFVVLAGFLARVPDNILHAYPQRMVNIHPSLLPKFGGKGMYGDRVHQAVLAAGETESGITIHYTNEHYDEGAVIRQYACPVLTDDTPDTLAARVHQLEYAHYPEVIEALVQALPG